ncbi:hypothetical protein LVJ85_05675 [Neisseria sp. Dent CA1/247]|uniref:hypothetical protein n=1 Tax=Neisseria sp. Dent CA1/247 TaxID=2912675 RepID=UPI001FD47D5E|nr:hypothetical protein [Neisseria sp. Dent CA1/247]UOO77951.1 hypothetical protein LVJ85_05675 [Neisseria sp. Dent CA1/247]
MKRDSLTAAKELTKSILETQPDMIIRYHSEVKETANRLADFIETLAERIDSASDKFNENF